jgi:hypothetical protein
MTDDLDELLAPRPVPPANADLFARTERALARGRQLRQVGRVAAGLGVFALGLTLGWVAKPDAPVRAPSPDVISVPVVLPVPVGGSDPGPVVKAEPATAGAAELLAEQADDPAEAARLYRLAGDKFLNDTQDFRNARRCYRLFLARAGDTGLSPAAADTWLLADLKATIRKERTDATKNDG